MQELAEDRLVHPIAFPILLVIGQRLIPATKREMTTFYLESHIAGDKWVLKRLNLDENNRPRYLIDRTGRLRAFTIQRVRRRWARSFSRLLNLMRADCTIEAPIGVRVGDLLDRVRELRGAPKSRLSGQLRLFLEHRPPAEPFDSVAFRQFWDKYCVALNEREWSEELP